MSSLEKKGYIKSQWNMETERPRKVYNLTKDGENVLNFAEGSLSLMRKNLVPENRITIDAKSGGSMFSPRNRRIVA